MRPRSSPCTDRSSSSSPPRIELHPMPSSFPATSFLPNEDRADSHLPGFLQGDETSGANDDMVEERDPHHFAGLHQSLRQRDIVLARGRVAARVIGAEDEAGTAV